MTVVDRSGRRVGVWQEKFGTVISGLTFSPDSEQLVTTRFPVEQADADAGEVVTWDWRQDDVVPYIDTPADFAVASPSGHLVATTTRQATVLGG